MIGVDTNVLARLIVKDDARQLEQARQEIRAIRKSGSDVYVSHIVLCELSWLLGSRYKFSKQQLLSSLEHIILGEDFVTEDEDLIHEVFELYQKSKADFADILIALRNRKAGCKHTLTFDTQAAKAKGFKKMA